MDQSSSSTNQNLSIIHWNTNGQISHYQEFKHTTNSLSPSIMCIQETHLIPNDSYTFRIYPYTLVRKDSSYGTRRSGVATFIKNNIPYKDITPNTNIDIQTIEIYIGSLTITIKLLPSPG